MNPTTPQPSDDVRPADVAAAQEHYQGVECISSYESLVKSLSSLIARHARAEREELASLKLHTTKAAEAMGFLRFAAHFYGLNGPAWSEEPGFGQSMTNAMLQSRAEHDGALKELTALRAELQRVRAAGEQAKKSLTEARRKYQDGFDCAPFCELSGAMEQLLAALATWEGASK